MSFGIYVTKKNRIRLISYIGTSLTNLDGGLLSAMVALILTHLGFKDDLVII